MEPCSWGPGTGGWIFTVYYLMFLDIFNHVSVLRVNSGRYIIPFFFFSIEKGPSQILFASELSYRLRVKTKNSKGKRRLVFCSRAYKSWRFRDFPGGPVGKTPRSQCRGLCSIPGRGTRSHMHAATKSPHSAIKKNPTCRNWRSHVLQRRYRVLQLRPDAA